MQRVPLDVGGESTYSFGIDNWFLFVLGIFLVILAIYVPIWLFKYIRQKCKQS